MAVGDFLKPQRSPLSVYDEQMAEMLRQQSAGIGPQAIAQESALGFPVGTMTAKILGNVLAGAKEKRAINRDEQQKRARTLLARIAAGDLPEGVVMDDSGNFTTTIKEAERIEQPPEKLQQSTYQEYVPAQEFRPEVTKEGMMLEGSAENPNLLERTFFGDVEGKSIEDKYDLIEEAGYDPDQYLRREKQDLINEEALEIQRQDRLFALEDRNLINQGRWADLQLKNDTLKMNAFALEQKEMEVNENKIGLQRSLKKQREIMNIDKSLKNLKFNLTEEGYLKQEKLRALKYAQAGYAKEAQEILKGLKDTGLLTTLESKDKIKFVKDFNEIETKNFKSVKDSVENYRQLLKAAQANNGVGSYSLMIKYLKALDNSVVREGEVRTFGSMQGFIKQLEIDVEKLGGKGFPPSIRNAMLDQAFSVIQLSMRDYNNNKADRIETYKGLGIDPLDVYSGLERLDTTGIILPRINKDTEELDYNNAIQLDPLYTLRSSQDIGIDVDLKENPEDDDLYE